MNGINSSGTIVGSYRDSQSVMHGFIRISDGTFTVFDVSSSTLFIVGDVNNPGTIAGSFTDANGVHGYLRPPSGAITPFDVPGVIAGDFLLTNRINAGGTVAGYYVSLLSGSPSFASFVRAADGTFAMLDASSCGVSPGRGITSGDINTGGTVVGQVVDASVALGSPNIQLITGHSFMRAADGTCTAFDPPGPGNIYSESIGINDAGAIVGSFLDANLVQHGFLRNPDGTFVTIDDPEAAQIPLSQTNILTNMGTRPFRINIHGLIVGSFTDSSGARHGFLRE